MSTSAVNLPRISIDDYYRIERESVEKNDWFEGGMYNMYGGSTDHSQIKMNLSGLLFVGLKGKPCRPLDCDQRLKVPSSGLRTYPDASVYCGEIEYDEEDDQRHTATNPTVVFEVLSPSTEGYDRGLKAEGFRQISSLKAYVLISQDRPHVEVFERQEDATWRLREAHGIGAEIGIDAIGLTLDLADLYDRVDFAPSGRTGRPAPPARLTP